MFHDFVNTSPGKILKEYGFSNKNIPDDRGRPGEIRMKPDHMMWLVWRVGFGAARYPEMVFCVFPILTNVKYTSFHPQALLEVLVSSVGK